MVERHHHGVGGRLRRHPVGQEEGGQRRGAVGLPRHVGEAAHGFGQRAESRTIAGRSAAAEPAHVQHDDPRIGGAHRLVVEAPTGQRAGAVVHHHDIADGQQSVEQLLAVLIAQVEGDALLVAAHALPEQTDAVLHVTPGAQRVTGTRLLHLDHLGAELPEGGGHHGTGGQGRRVDDADAAQREVGRIRHAARLRDARARGARAGSSRLYSRRKTPRRCSSGTTRRTTSS